MINKLLKEKEELRARLSDINDAIDAFQKVCKHKHDDGEDAMVWYGNDSHKDYYRCKICSYETWG